MDGDFRVIYKGDVKFKKQALILILTLILGLILCNAVSAAGLANSSWPKSGHDLNNTGQSQYNGPQTNATKWNYTTGGRLFTAPVIGSDGTIYFGNFDKNLYALNPNGTQKWNYTTGSLIFSAPAIGDDGTIYFGSADKNLYALNPDGTQKWNYTAKLGIGSDITIGNDGTIYFGSGDKNLYALNPDGTLKWNFTAEDMTFLAPAIGSDGTIYFGNWDTHLYALNPDGTQKWNYTTGGSITSAPAIGSDGTIYFGSGDNNTYALYYDGTLKWKFTTGNRVAVSPVIGNDGTVYIGSDDGNLYALNPDGILKWKYTTGGEMASVPIIGNDGTLYFGSDFGSVVDGYEELYALNPNGTQKWNYTAGNGMSASLAIGSDGTLYFGSVGTLYALHDNVLVAGVDPAGNAVNVPAGKVIKITFTSPIKMGSGQIELKDSSGNTVPFTTSIKGSILTITPANSLISGKYILTLYNDCVTDLDGNHLELYSTSFTVDAAPPNVSANQTGGISNSSIKVKLSSEPDATIYYKINGGSWGTFTGSGTVSINVEGINSLEFYAVDAAGNPSQHTIYIYTIDKTAPAVSATPSSVSLSKNSINVAISSESDAAIYYRINGGSWSTFTGSGAVSINSEGINSLEFYAVDAAGNPSQHTTYTYIIDKTAPAVSATPSSVSLSKNSINVAISSEPDSTIHYRLNGGSWNTFTGSGAVSINAEGINSLEFYAVDTAGNPSAHKTCTYIIDKTAPAVSVTPSSVPLSKNSISVLISSELDSTIYYKVNNGLWSTFTGSGTVLISGEGITDLEMYAVDAAGNPSNPTMYSYVIDKTAPVVDASPKKGLSNSSISVNLLSESNAVIYYRVNSGSWKTFTGSGTVVISSVGTNELEFYAVDAAGNPSQHTTYRYTIDKTAPVVTATPTGGLAGSINVTLSSESNAKIYYRINRGSWHTFTGKGKVSINNSGTNKLEFYAVDAAGNPSAHKTCTYTIDKTAPKVVLTAPKAGAVGVSRTATIKIKFSENIKSSINWSKIYIKNLKTGKTVVISKSILGNTLYIKMASKRYAYSWYQVYIPISAVKDSAGNSLAAGYTFRFKTGRY
ncbi:MULTISPECIES: PQQ-binding-like beta-propeller repeat protein [Methanobacterium]|uniref:PQQ-binding-like beta-propeller repeat protein n=1 Tax=Methanobacterium veterum TaxID=408577 RepID=A0A9E5A2H5_9EURY|nr:MULTISPECIES: PQQ-binding-like beta-propeller repeat protein [Methanobacterium]MCZ3371916.1 PQQ-binding-like beta-propeller repeat protein [Methanobacterium veterum]